jgi:hypothetical protein
MAMKKKAYVVVAMEAVHARLQVDEQRNSGDLEWTETIHQLQSCGTGTCVKQKVSKIK